MKSQLLICTFLFSMNLLLAQSWEQVAPLPRGVFDARHHPVTFSVDGYGYLLTGAVDGVVANDFMRYDASTDTWEILPDFPGAARSFSYGTSRGVKAYVGFGGDGDGTFNDLWEYDTQTEEWTQLASCPCIGRFHPAFVQLEDKIFVGMGNGNGNYNDWWEYDIATNSWTQKDDLPGPTRHHPFYFGIDSIAYVGFGHGDNMFGNLQIYNDFYKFDPSTDEWTRLNDFPGEARVAGTQFDYNGKGFVLSGDGDDHFFMADGEMWEYDPSTDEWTEREPHPGGSRWAPGSFVIDDYVYLMCGLSIDQLESDMMRYNLNPIQTSTVESEKLEISAIPNPVKNVITLSDDISAFSEIRLLNENGKFIQKITSQNTSVEALSNGAYYLQFYKDDKMHSEKILILN